MFSILIPTFNNLPYLKLCIKSIEKHTKENYEIILHINDGSDGTLDFIKKKKFSVYLFKVKYRLMFID